MLGNKGKGHIGRGGLLMTVVYMVTVQYGTLSDENHIENEQDDRVIVLNNYVQVKKR